MMWHSRWYSQELVCRAGYRMGAVVAARWWAIHRPPPLAQVCMHPVHERHMGPNTNGMSRSMANTHKSMTTVLSSTHVAWVMREAASRGVLHTVVAVDWQAGWFAVCQGGSAWPAANAAYCQWQPPGVVGTRQQSSVLAEGVATRQCRFVGYARWPPCIEPCA